MADFNISITDNAEEVRKALQDKAEAALEACGNQAVSHAKSNITEAGRVDTGDMRKSLTHQVRMGEKTVYVGTNIEYAIYNEFGTGIYVEGGKGRQTPWAYTDNQGVTHWTRGMKPIHFLKRAISENVKQYKAIMEQYLKK